MDEVRGIGIVGFFRSPLQPENSRIEVSLDSLKIAQLFEEQSVFCIDTRTNHWRRARYGGQRPDGGHLVIFRSDDRHDFDIEDIYVLNLPEGESLNPSHFLKARCNDTPYFTEWRHSYIRSYIEQRASCRSISSIPSSSIELEPHQLAVVRRVLQDENKKYLLADEVGLGKTIEAGLVLREQLLEEGKHSIAVVTVPITLLDQWRTELKERFYLADLFEESLFICSHDELHEVLQKHTPTILVIDEAHHLASWAWSGQTRDTQKYLEVASAARMAKTCLLLSGTPLNGNEVNFLAMLHLIAPDSYTLSDSGMSEFKQRIIKRERLGGIYQALIPSNDNSTLTDLLDQVIGLFPNDPELLKIIDATRPHVDWLADEESEERESAIKYLRHYLGENFRLHQRLLRNRREDQGVALLFPGLDGVLIKYWPIDSYSLSVEQFLDSFRSEYLESNNDFLAITRENFTSWIEDALVSPMLIVTRGRDALKEFNNELEQVESEALQTLIEFAEQEQDAKDTALLTSISEWQLIHPLGRIIVFCSVENIADHVAEYLQKELSGDVERHDSRSIPAFCSNETIRVLVCDHAGEDGLNLNGGEKLVIHYSLPFSFSRIEQRLGRVNRYSAHIQAKPVKSLLLLPDSQSYSYRWQKILVDAVGIFNHSVASLQYVLEKHIDQAWREILPLGLNSLEILEEKLTGERGLIAIERQRVMVQEDLNKLDDEIESANRFAIEVGQADNIAEEHASLMFNWIIRGLQFEKIIGDNKETFRFRYNTGAGGGRRTLLDVKTLTSECLSGIDYAKSDYSSPVTALMSADRQIASHGRQIYPFRYGQPFVDVIYRALQQDVRGICSAMFRFVNTKLPSPKAFFRIEWLLSKTDQHASRTSQRVGDEIFSPRIIRHWLSQSGQPVAHEKVRALLEEPYFKKLGMYYQDKNIRPEYWPHLDDDFPKEHWPELVDKIIDSSRHYLDDELEKLSCAGEGIQRELIGASVVFLVEKPS